MKKAYYYTVSSIFTVIAIVHLFRVVQGWGAVVGGVVIPVWFSWVAFVLAGYLAVRGFLYSRETWIDRIIERS